MLQKKKARTACNVTQVIKKPIIFIKRKVLAKLTSQAVIPYPLLKSTETNYQIYMAIHLKLQFKLGHDFSHRLSDPKTSP